MTDKLETISLNAVCDICGEKDIIFIYKNLPDFIEENEIACCKKCGDFLEEEKASQDRVYEELHDPYLDRW